MNCLLVEKLSKSYGEKTLFENITFGLDIGQKVALIARNGAGKTTLLNIITGLDTPDEGLISFRKGIKTAYLAQNPFLQENLTVLEVIFHSDNPNIEAIRNYELHLAALKKTDDPAHHKSFEEAIATMDRLNAWDYEARAKEILGRFGIAEMDQPVRELSGGMKKKLALAKVLIDEVDLLILDEPTNHLDISMIEWLEEYLSREKLSLLLVSHDRYFLDNVCEEILELENGNLYRYGGNYAYYLEKKAEREYNELAELDKVRNLYRQELEWFRQSPQARTTKAKARIDAFFELKEQAAKRPPRKAASLVVKPERMGNKILEINYLCKSYGKTRLLEDFSHTFKRGEKIGVVGKNGSGKTTFLELIMGKVPADKGRIVKGQTVAFGYYSQQGPVPPGDKRIIELVREIAEVIPLGNGKEMSAAQFLFHFGFDYTTQYNYYHNLSGGERRKLYLLMTLMHNPNFLLLDEPTNDLDIYTLNVLEDFLSNFNGCVMFVSHDRYFIDKMSDHIFVFSGDGKVKDYYGTYSEYHLLQKKREAALRRKMSLEKPKKEVPRASPLVPKLTYRQRVELEKLEREIPELEAEKAGILEQMSSGQSDPETLLKLSIRYEEVEKQLDEMTDRWMELTEIGG